MLELFMRQLFGNIMKIKKVCLFLLFVAGVSHCATENSESDLKDTEKPLKVLVLIIASDNFPVYRELQKMWRAYMHLDPEHVEAYFMKANPHQREQVRIEGDVIWLRTKEGLVPGIINKTILSLEFFLPRIKTEFSYVLRPNLSSFYYFPGLLQFLKTCPRDDFYGGSDVGPHDPSVASGCGFLLSPDVAELLVAHKHQLLNQRRYNDDETIAKFLKTKNIFIYRHARTDFLTMDAWLDTKNIISEDIFHFRVKNNDPNKRMTHELHIYSELLSRYYGKAVPYAISCAEAFGSTH